MKATASTGNLVRNERKWASQPVIHQHGIASVNRKRGGSVNVTESSRLEFWVVAIA